MDILVYCQEKEQRDDFLVLVAYQVSQGYNPLFLYPSMVLHWQSNELQLGVSVQLTSKSKIKVGFTIYWITWL